MAVSSKEKFGLKKLLKELATYRGRHTELVTVYVPEGYDLNKINTHLSQEQGTATNIKSKGTRDNVIAALEKMLQHLKLFKRTPPNGLALFSGNVAERDGQQDVKVWSIEPPEPLNQRLYRCDKLFVLEPLQDMLDTKECYGLIVIDRRDANIAMLKGKTIIPLTKTHSQVPGKMKAGGQCLLQDTIVQSASGDLAAISNCHNPQIVKSMVIDNHSIKDSPVTDKWDTEKNTVFKITTKFPSLTVESSKDHVFFVSTENGIVEMPAELLKEGDILLMPEKIDVEGKIQYLNSKLCYNSFMITKAGQELLTNRRKNRSLHQKELASLIGATQTLISKAEIGKENISKQYLKKICEALDIKFAEFIEHYSEPFHQQGTSVKLPEQISQKFAQFIGYLVGDGSVEEDRISFFEQRKELALKLKEMFDNFFNIQSSYKFREEKNYHQLRFTSRPLVRLIRNEFPEIKFALDSTIPKKILESPNPVVASFLQGIYDAEGYISQHVGIGMNNKILIQQIQMLLLRFSILASFAEKSSEKNPYSDEPCFKLQITEKQSLELFQEFIGFNASDKADKLNKMIESKTDKSSMRQILTPGTVVRKLIEDAGYNLELFPKVNSFFKNKRKMSKQAFKSSILTKVKDPELYKKLEVIYKNPILPVEISKIEVRDEKTKMSDISVNNQNFIANGLIVHNSAQRFERIREGAALEHYKKVAEHVKENFLMNKDLKGIIVGGPGQTKHEFLEKGQLTQELKDKVIAVKDLSYTGEFGLQELLDKSQDVLANEEIAAEKKIMAKFFQLLSTKPKMVEYGKMQVMTRLKMGAVDVLLLSDKCSDETIEEFEEQAGIVGSEVQIISTETREGVQLRELGEVAAILRYEVE